MRASKGHRTAAAERRATTPAPSTRQDGGNTSNEATAARRPRSRIRKALGLVAACLALVGAMSPTFACAALPKAKADLPVPAISQAASSEPAISVTATPSTTNSTSCAQGQLGLTPKVTNTAEAFTLTIVSSVAPCQPITAKAVVYRMPGDGVAWPQELMELEQFVISGTGTWEVRFAKQCIPTQFDVVTGATPQTIAPWGAHHGPLLFFPNTATSLQYWGAGDCGPGDHGGSTSTTTTTATTTTDSTTTTTTTSTSTTTTSAVPTTTTAPGVSIVTIAPTTTTPTTTALPEPGQTSTTIPGSTVPASVPSTSTPDSGQPNENSTTVPGNTVPSAVPSTSAPDGSRTLSASATAPGNAPNGSTARPARLSITG